jgi:hypothetical protein
LSDCVRTGRLKSDRICNAIGNFDFSYNKGSRHEREERPRAAILGKKPALGDAIKSEQVRMTAAIFYAKTKMGWRETVVNEQVNK